MLSAVRTKKQNKTSAGLIRLLVPAAAILLAFASLAPAQTTSSGASGDRSAPVFYPSPPVGFDALAAPDAELARYGIPPRPPQSESLLFADWLRVATTPQVRLTNLTVQPTSIINGPAKNLHVNGTVGNITSETSANWSAYAVNAPSNTFAVNNSYTTLLIEGLPAVGTENCTYGPYYASQWTGFDGAGNSQDVLQAGVAVTACGSGTFYVAWYEWYVTGCSAVPCYQTNVSLPVHPNDDIYVDVWYTTSSPNGHAYIWDQTTGQSTSIGFNEPSPGGFAGNSVEWVVERPEIAFDLPDLVNYAPFQSHAAAYNGTYFGPETSPAGTTIDNITMVCDGYWSPVNNCSLPTSPLSSAVAQGLYGVYFYPQGPVVSNP